MGQLQELETSASSLLDKAKNSSVSELAAAVEKATGVLRLSSDIKKTEAELQNLELERKKLERENATVLWQEKSERRKEVIAFLTATIPIIALAATVFLQAWQFTRSEQDKAEAFLDAQWGDTVKKISEKSNLSPTVVLLNPFLKSTKYHTQAQELAIQLLVVGTDKQTFDDIFEAAFVPASWKDLEAIIRLDRALEARGQPIASKSWDSQKQDNILDKLTDPEKQTYDYIYGVIPPVSVQIASLLRSQRPPNVSLNLSATRISDCDLGGADLSSANITKTIFSRVKLKGVNLDKITEFAGAGFYQVAWWEADGISPELLAYLENDPDAKYDTHRQYGPAYEAVAPQVYATAIARLKAKAH
jgi:hypothetical protein